jgi:UDP-galactopyranose mutase
MAINMLNPSKKFLFIGAGLSCCVLARRLVELNPDIVCDIIDKRDHIGGNCFTYIDDATGITVHKYGPHIFNTSNTTIVDYIRRFSEFDDYTHRVKAIIPGDGVYTLPINLHTINQIYNATLSPSEAATLINKERILLERPAYNFEEQALAFLGDTIYQKLIYGYTKKQWGCEPSELPSSIIKRLPVRFNYNDSYYSSSYSGIPSNGYTEIFAKMLTLDQINVYLGQSFSKSMQTDYNHIFYSGPIDQYFDYIHGRLGYRTVSWMHYQDNGDYQGNAQNNYPSMLQDYTRIIEHKHFTPHCSFDNTLYSVEYSSETGPNDEPYYPKRLPNDLERFANYINSAHRQDRVSFIGRLGTYRYLDMHKVIGESLQFAEVINKCIRDGMQVPIFLLEKNQLLS